MLLVIPRLDIRDGRCDYGSCSEQAYLLRDPVAMCKLWRVQNAKTLLLADLPHRSLAAEPGEASASSLLGSAAAHATHQGIGGESVGQDTSVREAGAPDNGPSERIAPAAGSPNVAAITRVCSAVDIPVQVDCCSVDLDTARGYLECGVYRIVLPSSIGPATYSKLASAFGARRLAIRLAPADTPETTTAFVEHGCCRFFADLPAPTSDADWSALAATAGIAPQAGFTVEGPAVDYPTLAETVRLGPARLDSVVIGEALYQMRFPCQASWCWNRVADVDIDCFSSAAIISAKKNVGMKNSPQQ